MGNEQYYVRSPLAKTINATGTWEWIPTRNVVANGRSSLMPGTPDGHAHKWGGGGIIYFETKAATDESLTSIDLSEWDRQRNWWEKNCRNFGNIPYWIVFGVYSELHPPTKKGSDYSLDLSWPQWRWFAVTPEMWLDAQAQLCQLTNGKRTSLSLNPLTERTIALRSFTVESIWADYCLWYQSGKFVFPPEHPLNILLNRSTT